MEILGQLNEALTWDGLLLAAHREHLDADFRRLLDRIHEAEGLVEVVATDKQP